MEREIIKKGTNLWWTWVGMLHIAQAERKRLGLAPESEVTISIDQVNEYLQGLNWIKQFWLLLTIGGLHPVDRDKLGKEVAIKAEDGIIHEFFKDK